MRLRLVFTLAVSLLAEGVRAKPIDAAALVDVDRIFADWVLDAHVPGLVYGIVQDGRLVHVRGFGVQETDTRRPVTADSHPSRRDVRLLVPSVTARNGLGIS